MANLPEQLQRQVDEAEVVLQQLQQENTAPATPAASVQATDIPQSASVASVQPATTPEDQNSETYAQRWRSLQGIHNTTLRRLQDTSQRVAQLEHMLSTLQAQPPAQPQPQQSTQSSGYLTEKDRTDYADSIDVMRRAAREEFAPVIAQLQQTINSLGQNVSTQVQRVEQRQSMTQAEIFYQKLKQVVPNWEQINASPDFQAWLGEVDPQTGIQRQIYLNDAHSRLDVDRVAYFFRAGAAQHQAAPAQISPQTVTHSAPSQLELQVSPGRTRTTAPTHTGNTQEKQWARSAISKFYDEVRRGLYRGKDAERAQIENDIIAASSQGRIVAG